MAWQAEKGSGSARATNQTAATGDSVARDMLTKLVQFACSQHVATVAINNGGTATYVVGDVMTLTHASAHLDARFEVTAVSVGVITELRIISSGAFAQQAVSATVSAGGTGYNTGDIIAVDGGSSRLPAKFLVTAAAGAVTSVSLYEGGGVYATTPSNPAATTKVGPVAGSGSGATLTVTYQALITPLTNVAITGGSGGGSPTVDITLAETGWAVDGRDHNDWPDDDQSNTDQKQVTLVGDAVGSTNKPFVHFATGYTTSGVDTRCWIQVNMSLAHNSSLTIDNQPGLGGGYVNDNGCYMLMPENSHNNTLLTRDTDFWFQVNDSHIHVQFNVDTNGGDGDNGRYLFGHGGFFERLGTESEYPYPGLFGASSRNRDLDPLLSSNDISSIAELNSGGNGPCYYYQAESSVWHILRNAQNAGIGEGTDVTFPYGDHPTENSSTDPHNIMGDNQLVINNSCIKRDRSSSTRVLRLVPGTTDQYMLYPLIIVRQETNTPNETTDAPKGQIQGCFWVYNENPASPGTTVVNFAEDYVEIGSNPTTAVRYRIFHNHVHQARAYQFVAILEDV